MASCLSSFRVAPSFTSIALLIIWVCTTGIDGAEQDVGSEETWVIGEGVSYLGDFTTVETAQRVSLEAARRAAIEKGVGAFISSSTIVRNAQLTEDLVHVVARGIIVDEQILERGVKVETAAPQEETSQSLEQLAYITKIKAKIAKIPAEEHGNFVVTVGLNRSAYQNGDDAEIRVTPSEDAYLYIFGVSDDDHITILAPNRYYQNTLVKGGTDFIFPPDTLVKRGIRLQTWAVPGKPKTVEKIKVIASKRTMDALKGKIQEAMFASYSPSDHTMLVHLLRSLATFDPSEWAENTVTYEVYAK